jgi:hypothetical protein
MTYREYREYRAQGNGRFVSFTLSMPAWLSYGSAILVGGTIGWFL